MILFESGKESFQFTFVPSHPGYLCVNSNKSLVCPPWIALRIQNCLMWSTKAGKIGQIWKEHHQLNAWIIPNQTLAQICTLKQSPIHDAHAWKIDKWPSQHTEKKLGRGSPIHNDFSFTPSPFPSQHKVWRGEKEVGGVLALLWTTETCTKVQLQVW